MQQHRITNRTSWPFKPLHYCNAARQTIATNELISQETHLKNTTISDKDKTNPTAPSTDTS